MRTPIPLVVVFALVLLGCSPANKKGAGGNVRPGSNKGPLSFQLPAGWKMEHQTPGSLHFYTVTAATADGGLLMFSQWPPPSRPEDIPGLVQKLADGFVDQAKKLPDFSLASDDYRIEQFTGSECQGSYAVFQTSSGGTNVLQTMFMMSVGARVWNGQFTGPSNAWIQAIGVLKSVKNNG